MPGCVTRIVRWQTLEERMCKLRLLMRFKIQHGLVDMVPGNILRPSDHRTRGGHRLYQPAAPQNVYKFSSYPEPSESWTQCQQVSLMSTTSKYSRPLWMTPLQPSLFDRNSPDTVYIVLVVNTEILQSAKTFDLRRDEQKKTPHRLDCMAVSVTK